MKHGAGRAALPSLKIVRVRKSCSEMHLDPMYAGNHERANEGHIPFMVAESDYI